MNDHLPVPDLEARERALDPATSFIVQAPAGSGKTELLIQRSLVLLATVERPEELLAITFTNKAASEMHKRIFDALHAARRKPRPEAGHAARTWDLARAVLGRSDARDWNLEENASRLKVQTIDGMCLAIAHRMPVLSRFGAPLQPTEEADRHYLEAARNVLAILEDRRDPAAADVAKLLVHVDNEARKAEALLAALLRRRDHWIRNVPRARDRRGLERAIDALRRMEVERLLVLWPVGRSHPVEGNLSAAGVLEGWIAWAGAALTKEGKWRANLPMREQLAGDHALLAAVQLVRALPPASYGEVQWQALEAMVRLLPRAIAELRLVFAARGEADFVEIAQGALAALGTPDDPTDLLLAFDYRVRHILVDEFQDTSFTQFELLERLTAGWEPGDGRTLFAVGDPMQSIYRFRQAEVGLFLAARRDGIGHVQLEPLTLTANFRSQAGLVQWVNGTFRPMMPVAEDVAAGAVPFSDSRPVHADSGEAVGIHPFFDRDRLSEARCVAEVVRRARDLDPKGTTAILVRSRSHLLEIVPALRAAGLALRAVEIEPLGQRPVIQDLLSLTRALSHLADRTAWLSLLRAPWCGLTLADLHALCAPGEARDPPTVWEQMGDAERVAQLSADGRGRLERTRAILAETQSQRFRAPLRDVVEGAWLRLGGPAALETASDLGDADIFLDLVEQYEDAGALTDLEAFTARAQSLHALPDPEAGGELQAMTIHKSKGLEFDTVILPGLGSPTGKDPRELLLWLERPASEGRDGLIVAPINAKGSDEDRLYELVRAFDRQKSGHETARLLYVAATRARKRLHLTGCVARDEAGASKPPAKGTLLEKLWPVVAGDFARAAGACAGPSGADDLPPVVPDRSLDQSLRRLPAGWRAPSVAQAVGWTAPAEEDATDTSIEYSWAGETARRVGTVAHRWLQRMAEDSLQGWDAARVGALAGTFRAGLAEAGVAEPELDAAARRVGEVLLGALADERGRWVLGPRAQAHCEYRLSMVADRRVRHLTLDRTFVEDGCRWIVDYKTSAHEGADREAFLDLQQARYAGQLQGYALAVGGPVRMGLYFPLLRGWRAW